MLNETSRFHLVIDVIDRVPKLRTKAAHLKEEMKNAIIDNLALRARARHRPARDCQLDLAVLRPDIEDEPMSISGSAAISRSRDRPMRGSGRSVASRTSTSCASTRSAPWRWMRCSRPTPVIPERRWRWRRWSIACGSAFCASTPAIRSGPTATASSCRSGHASMLLYAMLHLTGVKAVNPEVRNARRTVGHAGGHQAVSAARQQVSRPPGISLDFRCRDDHGPAGTGSGHQRRHGDRRALAGELLQSSRVRSLRLRRLCPVRRRLHDGRSLRRSGVTGRASQARQLVLDLRQQQHHDRRKHGAGVQR